MKFALALVCSLGASTAFAWGATGHQIVNTAATRLMTSPGAAFFRLNAATLKKLATTPDTKWKATNYADEAPLHFFQWDNYRASSAAAHLDRLLFSQVVHELGAAFVKTNGSAVWRTDQIFGKLVQALKAKDWVQSLQLAGVMGHYVGDMSQPMHDSSDYDGQSIGRRGVHAYFESTLVDRLDPAALTDAVVNAGGAIRQELDDQYAQDGDAGVQLVRTLGVAEATKGFDRLDEVLAEFSATSQDDEALKAFFPPCMGAGAANLAKIWDLAVADAGVTTFPATAPTVAEPAWFPLADPAAAQRD